MQIDYKLAPAMLAHTDPRVAELREKKIDIEKFMMGLKPEDRFFIRDGFLDEWDQKRYDAEVNKIVGYIRSGFERSLGIPAEALVDHVEEMEQVFPGLKTVLGPIKEQVDKEKCRGCALKNKMGPVYDFISARKAVLAPEKLEPIRTFIPLDAFNYITGAAMDYAVMARAKIPRVILSGPPAPPKPAQQAQQLGAPRTENPDNQLRPGCTDCVRKHLAQAVILLNEVMTGYSEDPHVHRWLALGHLAEAADEALKDHPQLAEQIRKIRLDLMNEVKK